MNKFLSLLKVQLRSQWGLSLAKYAMKNDKKALLKGIGLAFVIVLSLGQFVFFYTFLMSKLYEAGKMMQAPQLILIMGASGAGMFTLFFGIFFILGALFLAKDTEFLSSLPLKQQSIFLSKFLIVLLEEYLFVLFFMVPPIVIYGTGEGCGVLYYLTALACMVLVPLIPLVISAILSLGLMRLISQSRRRDLLTIVGSIIVLVGLLVGQFSLLSKIPEDDPNFLPQLLQDSDRIVEFTGRTFPPAIWITRALAGPDAAINFLYLLLSSAVAFLVVFALASFVYQRGAAAQLESLKRPVKTKLEYRVSSPVLITFKNEWRNLIRTPIYALNSLVIVFVGPLIMSMPLFGGNFANDPDIEALYNLINNHQTSTFLPFIFAAIVTLLAMINPAVSSTFSREGKAFWILKNIPVDPFRQVLGKLLAGYSISFTACVATAAIITFSFKVGFGIILMSILVSCLVLIPINVLGLFFDLLRPKLKWGNPQEAIKQNLNVILGMLAGFIYLAVIGALAFLLFTSVANASLVSGILIGVILLLAVGSVFLLKRVSGRLFKRIEA